MNRKLTYSLILCLTAGILAAPAARAQWGRARRKALQRQEQEQLAKEIAQEAPDVRLGPRSGYMGYRIEKGDTVYYDVLDPVWILPKGRSTSKNDMRQYYKLVYNFNKVYPYALCARRLSRRVDDYIADNDLRKRNGDKYINAMQKELFAIFEKPLRNMSVSQGRLLIKLVDREFGRSSYKIIKDYKSGITAGFWQGVAKIFGQDLKDRYDPDGADKITEYLVQMWDSGRFESLYFSIFQEVPKQIQVPDTEEAFARAAERVEGTRSKTR